MAKLLITGGAGFIGGNFVRYWAKRRPGDELIVLDALTYAANPATIADIEQAELVTGDIRDTALVRKILRDRDIDTIVHFAAESHVDRSIAGPNAFIETNVVGTHSLLEAARNAWIDRGGGRPHRFHHISTDEVYGSLDEGESAFTEASSYAPNSPYSASKASADFLVRAWHKTYGLEVTTSNSSNNYGPYQHPEKLIPRMLLHSLTGEKLPVYGDGRNVRDWLHVADHCNGIEMCLERGLPGECYNIGGEAEMANIDLVELLCSEVDRAFERIERLTERFPKAPAAQGLTSAEFITFVPDRPGHDRRYAIDNAKAKRELGFMPRRSLREGIADTVEWYLQGEAWWRPLLKS